MPLDRLPHGLEYFAGLHFPSLNYLLGNYDKELTNLPSSIKSVLLDKNLFEKKYFRYIFGEQSFNNFSYKAM